MDVQRQRFLHNAVDCSHTWEGSRGGGDSAFNDSNFSNTFKSDLIYVIVVIIPISAVPTSTFIFFMNDSDSDISTS